MPTLQAILWLCVAAYALHILEEFVFNWRDWARNVLGLAAEWNHFYLTNALVIVLGIVATQIAPVWPAVALAYPALMLINASFFHVLPFAMKRGRFSPGLATAVLLFYPLGIWAFYQADAGHGAIAESFVIGAILMALPVLMLQLRSHPYFHQQP